MNSLLRSKKEWLKEQLDRMEVNEHMQVLNIVRKYTDQLTKTQTGVLVSTDNLTNDCLKEIENYANQNGSVTDENSYIYTSLYHELYI
jgi:predicted transcriptional regulator